MANIPYPPTRQLSVGEVLDLTFRIYRATVVKCLLIAGFGVLAGQLASIYTLASGRPLISRATSLPELMAQMRDPELWVLYLVGALLSIVFYAAVLLRQRAMITDGAVGGELAAAVRRVPALIGLGVLVILGGVALFVPSLLAGGALRGLLILAAIVGLSYGIVAISCAQTILLIDRAGPAGSLARSWRLTTGSFWRLSVIYTVALIILLVLYMVAAAIAGFVAAVLGRGDFAITTAFADVVVVALGALATPFYTAIALAVLGDLKVRKEGADLEQRISSATA